jgi:hypothetical protein
MELDRFAEKPRLALLQPFSEMFQTKRLQTKLSRSLFPYPTHPPGKCRGGFKRPTHHQPKHLQIDGPPTNAPFSLLSLGDPLAHPVTSSTKHPT